MFVALGRFASRFGWGWTYETILFIMLLHPYMIKRKETREIGAQTGADESPGPLPVPRVMGMAKGTVKILLSTMLFMVFIMTVCCT